MPAISAIPTSGTALVRSARAGRVGQRACVTQAGAGTAVSRLPTAGVHDRRDRFPCADSSRVAGSESFSRGAAACATHSPNIASIRHNPGALLRPDASSVGRRCCADAGSSRRQVARYTRRIEIAGRPARGAVDAASRRRADAPSPVSARASVTGRVEDVASIGGALARTRTFARRASARAIGPTQTSRAARRQGPQALRRDSHDCQRQHSNQSNRDQPDLSACNADQPSSPRRPSCRRPAAPRRGTLRRRRRSPARWRRPARDDGVCTISATRSAPNSSSAALNVS